MFRLRQSSLYLSHPGLVNCTIGVSCRQIAAYSVADRTPSHGAGSSGSCEQKTKFHCVMSKIFIHIQVTMTSHGV